MNIDFKKILSIPRYVMYDNLLSLNNTIKQQKDIKTSQIRVILQTYFTIYGLSLLLNLRDYI